MSIIGPARTPTTRGDRLRNYANVVLLSHTANANQWVANTLLYAGSSTCYTRMVKTGPNEILVVYDELNHKEPGDTRAFNYVVVELLKVQRLFSTPLLA